MKDWQDQYFSITPHPLVSALSASLFIHTGQTCTQLTDSISRSPIYAHTVEAGFNIWKVILHVRYDSEHCNETNNDNIQGPSDFDLFWQCEDNKDATLFLRFYCCMCTCHAHTQREMAKLTLGPCVSLSGVTSWLGGVRTATNKEQGCYSVTELQSDLRLMTATVLKLDSALVWKHAFATRHRSG